MKKISKAIIASTLLVISIVACKETQFASQKAEPLQEDEPELTFKNINTLYTENTKPMLRMKAKVQLRYQSGNERYPEGIHIEMYKDDGMLRSTLVADSAIYTDSTNIYTVMGNVVVDSKEKGQKLETDLLNWNKETEGIFTDDSVKITEGQQILTGVGLTANQDFSEYEILNPTGIAYVDD